MLYGQHSKQKIKNAVNTTHTKHRTKRAIQATHKHKTERDIPTHRT